MSRGAIAMAPRGDRRLQLKLNQENSGEGISPEPPGTGAGARSLCYPTSVEGHRPVQFGDSIHGRGGNRQPSVGEPTVRRPGAAGDRGHGQRDASGGPCHDGANPFCCCICRDQALRRRPDPRHASLAALTDDAACSEAKCGPAISPTSASHGAISPGCARKGCGLTFRPRRRRHKIATLRCLANPAFVGVGSDVARGGEDWS